MGRRKQTIEDYVAKVKFTPKGCWVLPNIPEQNEYVRLCFADGKVLAHRWFYEQFIGPIPEGLQICHGCDVRNCVNPAHLFVGTAHDNMQDASRKGRLQRRHHFTILTKAQVQEIRNRLQTGEPCKSIARNYPVGMWAIHSIKQRKNWRAV